MSRKKTIFVKVCFLCILYSFLYYIVSICHPVIRFYLQNDLDKSSFMYYNHLWNKVFYKIRITLRTVSAGSRILISLHGGFMNYQIISDGSCDLPPQLVTEKKIKVVPFYVSFDGETYKKEIEELDIRYFYEHLVENPKVFPKTSLPSVQDYTDAFLPFAEKNIPVICICITTKFSGSMQSALTAREILLEDYPDAKITVIDATVNTVLQGLFVLEAVRMQEAGWKYEDVVNRLEEIKSTGRIFFTIGSIDYLMHGGRIGKLSGIAGSILGIKPLITLKKGEIFPSGITRNRTKSMNKVIDLLMDYLKELNADLNNYTMAVGFGYDYEECLVFRKLLLERVNEEYHLDDIPIYQIGAAIGVHTGPYPLGVGIMEKYDAKKQQI